MLEVISNRKSFISRIIEIYIYIYIYMIFIFSCCVGKWIRNTALEYYFFKRSFQNSEGSCRCWSFPKTAWWDTVFLSRSPFRSAEGSCRLTNFPQTTQWDTLVFSRFPIGRFSPLRFLQVFYEFFPFTSCSAFLLKN